MLVETSSVLNWQRFPAVLCNLMLKGGLEPPLPGITVCRPYEL
jgi:hypothetical protein